MSWLTEHWAEIAEGAGLLWVVLNVLNGALPHGAAQNAIGALLDLLSVLCRADSPGTLKPPARRSRRPGGTGRRKRGTSVLALIFLSSSAIVGCASPTVTAAKAVKSAANFELAAGKVLENVNTSKQADIARRFKSHEIGIEGAISEKDKWRGQRDKIRQSLAVFHFAVEGTRAGIKAAQMGDAIKLEPLLDELLKAGVALKDMLGAFGLQVPGGFL